MKYEGPTGEYFQVTNCHEGHALSLEQRKAGSLALIWFDTDENQILIDGKQFDFKKNEILCLTQFHKIKVQTIGAYRLLLFNRPFYCILDHDSEVGCKGVLYYGSSNVPTFPLVGSDLEVLETVWKMLCLEMESRDQLQLEMLQMMLKRILILCTRLYKKQENYTALEIGKQEIVREFNFLVEQHFKTEHTVSFYASELFKSPKTLSNIFKKIGAKTPLQYIQERILLEARRLLGYTDKPVTDIGFELGFQDIQTFSRFFKKQEQISPTEYRDKTY